MKKNILLLIVLLFVCNPFQSIMPMESIEDQLEDQFSNLSLQQKIQLPKELVIEIFCFVLDDGLHEKNERFYRLCYYKSQFLIFTNVCKPWRKVIFDNSKPFAKFLDDIFTPSVDDPDLEELKESLDYQSLATWYNVTKPLHFAAAQGFEGLVRYYLNIGNNNVCDFYGSTPLHYATARGKLSIIKILLEQKNTDVNAKDSKGMTPLMCALEARNNRIVVLLLDCPKINLGKVSMYEIQGVYTFRGAERKYFIRDHENILSEHLRLKKYVTSIHHLKQF